MDIQELRQKSEIELKGLLAECREKLRTLRFELAANRLKNTKEIPQLRKTVARISMLFSAQRAKRINSSP